MAQTAVRAMLDEEHPELPAPARAENAYILGSVGKHDVVIVCLPISQVGTVAVALTTASVTTTSRSLRFLLIVGTGGGVPLGPGDDIGSSSDVRLGGVVVGVPNGRLPGVVQCDTAEVLPGGGLGRDGALNMSNPSRFLLNRLAILQTEHEMKGTKIPEYLEAMATKWPRLRERYCKSGSLQDVLFEANYSHVTGPGPSWDGIDGRNAPPGCGYCDPRRMIEREPREMKIYYGLISSGSKVGKNAILRDNINRQVLGGKVLCYEVETVGAAALLNFPFLVIRGICDYCDSHSNRAWQRHAAAVAAAFAVELLSHVPAVEVNRERSVWE
ncbi:ankyrin repeat protein [Colletotrichum plurivorum]|uniref:Ankyrin repeat protein n=1 Tax=Colletotrichum plurivorum TaxID=2175906 RepID=A0A8H6NH83_9PEZI|nr:ankyrin repeat protein [Colletotrichum plurivorum]